MLCSSCSKSKTKTKPLGTLMYLILILLAVASPFLPYLALMLPNAWADCIVRPPRRVGSPAQPADQYLVPDVSLGCRPPWGISAGTYGLYCLFLALPAWLVECWLVSKTQVPLEWKLTARLSCFYSELNISVLIFYLGGLVRLTCWDDSGLLSLTKKYLYDFWYWFLVKLILQPWSTHDRP